MYHKRMKDEHAEATRKGQKYRLQAFLQFCDEEGIEDLTELTGRDLFNYRIWRREGQGDGRDPVKLVTLKGQLATVKAFLREAAKFDAVDRELTEQIQFPNLRNGEDVSDTTLKPERTIEILDYLEHAEPGSSNHVILLLLWQTGARTGAVHGLDLEDIDLDGDHPRFTGPAVHFVNRPDQGTPLKKHDSGSRWNRISQKAAAYIQDYIDYHRSNVEDEHGRQPLLATEHGRMMKGTIRRSLYRITRPCWRGEECPHDRDLDECPAAADIHKATYCPSVRSPHDVRSGRVTYYRREDVPRRVVRDRLDASDHILDRHYDRRSDREQAEQRSNHLPDS